MSTIPASAIVNVTPGVLAAGGNALDLIGLLLSTAARVPIGSVQAFPSAAAVGDYFGSSSTEKDLADNYFGGFEGSNAKPGSVLFAQYPESAVSAFLRGGDMSGTTLAELQAMSGLLTVTIDGDLESASINLSTATSFSGAGQIIAAGLGITGVQSAVVTGSISGTTLTVSALASGALAAGDVLTGTGVTANTYIVSQLTGATGSIGTYQVSASQTAASQSITATGAAVTYDSVSGAFIVHSGTTGDDSTITYGSGALATLLLLTAATGAVISQGADAAVPAAFMDAVVQTTQNWASFMTCFDPDDDDENSVKLAFAAWTSDQNDRYAYVAWDNDLAPSASDSAAASFGALVADAAYSGIVPIGRDSADYDDLPNVAAFVCGSIASIDYAEFDGRTTLKFRRQSGLTASCSDETKASNLAANGYNFYGAYTTADDEFIFFANGVISGDFLWIDSYVNEVQLNNSLQLALVVLMTTAKSIPYNTAGYTRIEAALADPINAALNFGSIRAGVTLSTAQASAVNTAANARISDVLQQRGWYLQIGDATAEVRQARGSPPCKFWYMDGQSVQTIDLASVAVL